jgi:hypothetical protein
MPRNDEISVGELYEQLKNYSPDLEVSFGA